MVRLTEAAVNLQQENADNPNKKKRFRHEAERSNHRQNCRDGLPPMKELQHLFFDEASAVEFLFAKGILFRESTCGECGNLCKLKSSSILPGKKMTIDNQKFRCTRCKKVWSLRGDTFFGYCRKPFNEILLFFYYWLLKLNVTSISKMTEWDEETVSQYCQFAREMTLAIVLNDAENKMIGGEDIIVEIDESKLVKRKYHHGHRVEGTWVFGGIERLIGPNNKWKAGNTFAVAVQKRDVPTLISVVKEFVHPGSIIISDKWAAYEGMKKHGYKDHLTANHSKTFKDSKTGACTNIIEGQWRIFKKDIPNRNYHSAERVQEFLFEAKWRNKNKSRLWDALMDALKCIEYDKIDQNLYVHEEI